MKIVCPYTKLTDATEFALKYEHPSETLFVDVSKDEFAYFELMQEMWKAGETFVLVEHDIVPYPTALRQIYDCPHPLCAYEAPHVWRDYSPGTTMKPDDDPFIYGLGIVKFGEELMLKHPDHLDDPELDRTWIYVDGNLTARLLMRYDYKMHYHQPPVMHFSRKRFDV